MDIVWFQQRFISYMYRQIDETIFSAIFNKKNYSVSLIWLVGWMFFFLFPLLFNVFVTEGIRTIWQSWHLLPWLWWTIVHGDKFSLFCYIKNVLTLLQVKNSRGDVLQCSHYLPIVSPEGKPLPCVIYCHGNRWVIYENLYLITHLNKSFPRN